MNLWKNYLVSNSSQLINGFLLFGINLILGPQFCCLPKMNAELNNILTMWHKKVIQVY